MSLYSLMGTIIIKNEKYCKKLFLRNHNYINFNNLYHLQKLISKNYLNINPYYKKNIYIENKVSVLKDFFPLKDIMINENMLQLFASELKKIHKIIVTKKSIQNESWTFQSLSFFFENNIISALNDYSRYRYLLNNSYLKDKEDIKLCHNDLHFNNILYNDNKKQLKIIDYDFLNINDYYYDLASFISENNLTQRDKLLFLAHYSKTKLSMKKLDFYVLMENYINSMWANYMYEQKSSVIYYQIAIQKYQKLKKLTIQ